MTAWPRVAWLDAVLDSQLKPLERLVAAVYADAARDRPTVWLTLDRLTARTSLSRDAANRARHGLIEAGWLVQVGSSSRRQAKVYALAVPAASSTADGPLSSTADGPLTQPSSTPRGPLSSTPPDTSSTPDGPPWSARRTQSHRPEAKDARPPARGAAAANAPTPTPRRIGTRCPDCDESNWILLNPDDPRDQRTTRCTHPRRPAA